LAAAALTSRRRWAPRLAGVFVLAMCALVELPAHAQALTFAQAIDMAGRQRMLTQRITKAYVQIGLNADVGESLYELQDAITTFEEQLYVLQAFAPTTELTAALADISAKWAPFKQIAEAEPTKDGARRLHRMDEQLLRASDDVVHLLMDISDVEASHLVNMSGRQRMLSQRLAKFYMLEAAALGSPSLQLDMERARSDFVGGLDVLESAPENTPSIDELLKQAREQWLWLDTSTRPGEGSYYPIIVMRTSEKLLHLMEDLTRLYTELAAGS
jgi:uncharacterized protein YeaO (DUF488 family)